MSWMNKHEKLERNSLLLLVCVIVTVLIGGIVEIVPLFRMETVIEPVEGVRPYTPLELVGQNIYVREGCYNCHSQQIRPLRDEVVRYGHYSLAAESMYDYPFQWGSKRTGPDLARVGAKYSDEWQVDNTSPKGLDKFDDTFHENNYKKTVKKFSNNPKVKIIRDYSVNAAKMFDDKYFDFVYLDGDHSYEGVKKDLDSWYPKLKKFGVMCGDDYGNMHLPVIEAVSEFVYEHKLLVTCSEDKQFWFVKV